MGTIKSKMGTNIEHKRKAKWAGKKANFVEAYSNLPGLLWAAMMLCRVDLQVSEFFIPVFIHCSLILCGFMQPVSNHKLYKSYILA